MEDLSERKTGCVCTCTCTCIYVIIFPHDCTLLLSLPFLYLFPLVDVADETGQSEKTQQTEDLCEAHNAESTCGAVHIRRLVPGLQVNDEEKVINRNGGDEVHREPGAEVMHADLLGVQDDVAVFPQDASAEVENQVHEEESVGQDVEGDPGHGVLVLEEGDAPR